MAEEIGLMGGLFSLENIIKNKDMLVIIGVVAVVIMLIVPLPRVMLNVFITVNLTLALLILVTVMYVEKALDFSVFPSLLLITTLFRLGLNVSSTRLILGEGRKGVEGVITAFGDFVISGNYIIGIVIFLILILIQFLVIVKGANRISEVRARFSLDALPGKQMAIDADLNSGLITQADAEEKRNELRREADFFGDMDGASKFIQGDVIAGLVITFINILGGIAIGVWMRDETIVDAMQTYTLLTIGDGLVSQLPSLIIAVSTGLIISRSASTENLGSELISKLLRDAKVLAISGSAILLLGIFTPMPFIPFTLVGGSLLFLAYRIVKDNAAAAVPAEGEMEDEEEGKKKPVDPTGLLQPDTLELEIGYGLVLLVDPGQGGDLLQRIALVRQQCALNNGIIVPPVRIRDNLQLKPNAYKIKIKGDVMGGYEVYPDRFLAMESGPVSEKIAGEGTVEPAFGLPAIWITEDQRTKAEQAGYTVVDAASIIITHLEEIIKRYAHEILTLDDVNKIIESLKKDYPTVVNEVIPEKLKITQLKVVLENLLQEGISIRNMINILETLGAKAEQVKNLKLLTELVRKSLKRQICSTIIDDSGKINAVMFTPELQKNLISSLKADEHSQYLAYPMDRMENIMNNLQEVVEDYILKRENICLLVESRIRPSLREIVSARFPGIPVIAFDEIVKNVELNVVKLVDDARKEKNPEDDKENTDNQ